jgi:hypothetical protein
VTATPPPPSALPDGPEADVLEQHQPVDPDDAGELDAIPLTRDPEAPEADALEQARTVPLREDDHDAGQNDPDTDRIAELDTDV